jgi:hypothetical protein
LVSAIVAPAVAAVGGETNVAVPFGPGLKSPIGIGSGFAATITHAS